MGGHLPGTALPPRSLLFQRRLHFQPVRGSPRPLPTTPACVRGGSGTAPKAGRRDPTGRGWAEGGRPQVASHTPMKVHWATDTTVCSGGSWGPMPTDTGW